MSSSSRIRAANRRDSAILTEPGPCAYLGCRQEDRGEVPLGRELSTLLTPSRSVDGDPVRRGFVGGSARRCGGYRVGVRPQGLTRSLRGPRPSLLVVAAALPHVRGLSPARSTTAAPPRPDPISRRWTQPCHARWQHGGRAGGETVPVFTDDSLDEGGAQLCPCGIATATPQHFTVASRPDIHMPARKFPTEPSPVGAHHTRPISVRLEPVSP